MAILHFITDDEEPGRIIAAFRDALAPGSYLVVSHSTAGFHGQTIVDTATGIYARATAPLVLRGLPQVEALFQGWDLVDPGVVQVPLWRPDRRSLRPRELAKIGIYGGVGRLSR